MILMKKYAIFITKKVQVIIIAFTMKENKKNTTEGIRK